MIKFTKMSGAGNDFIIIDSGAQKIADPAALARQLCRRRIGIGADGIVLIEPGDKAELRMRIFNSDGSEAEMCGNAARCAMVFAHKSGLAGKEIAFETLAGIIPAALIPAGARIQLPDNTIARDIPGLAFADQVRDAFFLNTGVPHVVVPIDDLEATPVVKWGKAIRQHSGTAPGGSNVNFIVREGEGLIAVRTYERGVEDETLACGTGATAAALVAAVLWNLPSPIRVRTHSGEILSISFHINGDQVTDIFLEGPVKVIYEGQVEI